MIRFTHTDARANLQMVFALASLLLTLGCNQQLTEPRQGDYTGTFVATYDVQTQNGAWDTIITGPVSLNLNGNQYECTGNPNNYPAGGGGGYSIHGDSIAFQDENFWPADFDWNTILNGTYGFEATKKTLKLTRVVPNWATLEYNLLWD